MRKIKMAHIKLAKQHPFNDMVKIGRSKIKTRSKSVSGNCPENVPIVIETKPGKSYELYYGISLLNDAAAKKELWLDCEVFKSLTEQKVDELFLLDDYLCSISSPLVIGRRFRAHRMKYDLNQLTLSRQIGVSPGSIHQYESLAEKLDEQLAGNLESGEINFKEARCIADISGHARQRAVAQPFIDERLSSVHVEMLVSTVKVLTDIPASKIVDQFTDMIEAGNKISNAKDIIDTIRQSTYVSQAEPLENRVLKLAGELAELTLQQTPNTKRLRVISSLRILDSRLQLALSALSESDTQKAKSHHPNLKSEVS